MAREKVGRRIGRLSQWLSSDTVGFDDGSEVVNIKYVLKLRPKR